MSDATESLNAALEGRYAIDRELGEGGNGANGACHLWYELEPMGPSGHGTRAKRFMAYLR